MHLIDFMKLWPFIVVVILLVHFWFHRGAGTKEKETPRFFMPKSQMQYHFYCDGKWTIIKDGIPEGEFWFINSDGTLAKMIINIDIENEQNEIINTNDRR